MRGQRFAIRVELFPTRNLQNARKAIFSTAGAAADRPAAPPTTRAAQKSQSRPSQPPRPKKTDAQLALQTNFFRTLPKSTKKLGCQTSLALDLRQSVWPTHTWEAYELLCPVPLLVCHTHILCGSGTHVMGQKACLMVPQILKQVLSGSSWP